MAIIDPDKERQKFISLREVLYLISEARKCDPQKAAQWLVKNWQNVDLKYYDPVVGFQIAESDYRNDEGSGFSILDELIYRGIYREVEMPPSTWSDDDLPF